jgi:tellurite resistance protein TerC
VTHLWLWVAFAAVILVSLSMDLGVFHRRDQAPSARNALGWSLVWISLSLCFNLVVYFVLGSAKALEFLTAYLIEKSLSVDNIFVFLLIFSALRIGARYQHRVLFWGILGALVTRGVFIAAGVTLLAYFHWLFYVFAAILAVTALKMLFRGEDHSDPTQSPVRRWFQRFVPLSQRLEGGHFLTREQGRLCATPLLLALVLVESADIVFAVDSIPAVFAVTIDPFIVYTSNVFAILGLRALYQLLARLLERLRFLHHGLGILLLYVAVKMALIDVVKIPIAISLLVILGVLSVTVAISLLSPGKPRPQSAATAASIDQAFADPPAASPPDGQAVDVPASPPAQDGSGKPLER